MVVKLLKSLQWIPRYLGLKLLVKLNCNSAPVFTNHQSPTSIGETGETSNTGETGETGDTSDTSDTSDTGETSNTSNTSKTGKTGKGRVINHLIIFYQRPTPLPSSLIYI
ncbi:hypothetical protein F8M41_025057 [Gigaspora margarita]|uniref:Uncharacterized protein n=1 Tax=Gigaspora margarita TaxID=4874 RepID=A0A8H3XKW7_GIGMA|nr:hypothetical protein F8M41_025057 [Gigaspora margarita]